MEIRVPHDYSADEIGARIAAIAKREGIELTASADGLSGTLAKDAGFLGTVRARYSIEASELVVNVSERPAFLPEATLRRMLEDALAGLVAK